MLDHETPHHPDRGVRPRGLRPNQDVQRDIPYASPALERQITRHPCSKDAKNLPVVFWIHGGGA
jgi:acetyl esterase/lipase